MTPTEFCLWLQGFRELATPFSLDHKQLDILWARLDSVELQPAKPAPPPKTEVTWKSPTFSIPAHPLDDIMLRC